MKYYVSNNDLPGPKIKVNTSFPFQIESFGKIPHLSIFTWEESKWAKKTKKLSSRKPDFYFNIDPFTTVIFAVIVWAAVLSFYLFINQITLHGKNINKTL